LGAGAVAARAAAVVPELGAVVDVVEVDAVVVDDVDVVVPRVNVWRVVPPLHAAPVDRSAIARKSAVRLNA
jgi:hypothetical protein